MILRLLVLFSIISLTGCGSWIGGDDEIIDPPAVLTEFEPSIDVTRVWNKNTGSGTDDQYLMLAPIIANQKVFIADTDMKLMAYNSTNGKNIWSRSVSLGKSGFWSNSDEVHLTGGPGYGANMVIAGTSKGDVIAINAETGEELWTAKFPVKYCPYRKSRKMAPFWSELWTAGYLLLMGQTANAYGPMIKPYQH